MGFFDPTKKEDSTYTGDTRNVDSQEHERGVKKVTDGRHDLHAKRISRERRERERREILAKVNKLKKKEDKSAKIREDEE